MTLKAKIVLIILFVALVTQQGLHDMKIETLEKVDLMQTKLFSFELEQLKQEIAQLKKLAYVQGLKRCDKCNIHSSTATAVYDAEGKMHIEARENTETECPANCGGTLVPVTEREMREALQLAIDTGSPI